LSEMRDLMDSNKHHLKYDQFFYGQFRAIQELFAQDGALPKALSDSAWHHYDALEEKQKIIELVMHPPKRTGGPANFHGGGNPFEA